MPSVLYNGTDDRLPKMLEQLFQDLLKQTGATNSIVHVKKEKDFQEMLIGMAFDLVFIEQSTVGSQPGEWISSFRKQKPRVTAPMVLVGTDQDPVRVMKYVESGWMDYIHIPPDKALLIEKFMVYSSGKRSQDLRQVYSLQMAAPADMAKPGIVEELSEFDCKIRSSVQIGVNDLLILYSPAFGPDGKATGKVLGRCYNTQPHSSLDGFFQSSFYFVGITLDTLTNIRNSLRKQFVSGKAK